MNRHTRAQSAREGFKDLQPPFKPSSGWSKKDKGMEVSD